MLSISTVNNNQTNYTKVMSDKPTISVIMGIYNCENTLPEAIESIITQTYKDWELIMCDDASTDDTFNIAFRYTKQYPNIILLRNKENKGLSYTLNKCLSKSQGKYIARMDGDDISLPERFQKQVDILASYNNISIVSCPMLYFDKNGIWAKGRAIKFPDKYSYRLGSPYCHAPCMVKHEAYIEVGGYSEKPLHNRCEDYHLWYKMMKANIKGMNIQEHLYMMRDDQNAFKRRKIKDRIKGIKVQYQVFRGLNMPLINYLYILKGAILIFVPSFIYKYLHKRIISKVN